MGEGTKSAYTRVLSERGQPCKHSYNMILTLNTYQRQQPLKRKSNGNNTVFPRINAMFQIHAQHITRRETIMYSRKTKTSRLHYGHCCRLNILIITPQTTPIHRTLRATCRQSAASSLSSCLTPASRVYEEATLRTVLRGSIMCSAPTPFLDICLGIRYTSAICTFSSRV